ncbi:MAG TPA: hypothetical protein VJ343_02385 [archaeon]|nr:hypothetical protein [archaeon]
MKKGQAAMEYLMTYGWAILIVIVVVAALYAMGVFRLGSTSVACSPCFGEFAYVDYSATSHALVIRSGARSINITSMTPAGFQADNAAYVGTVLSPGRTMTLNTTSLSATDNPNLLTFVYIDTDSGLSHTDTASLRV